MKPTFRTRKAQGDWAELIFMARASALGFNVSKPHPSTTPYDVILEKDGHVWLVQVKSVTEPFSRKAYLIHTHISGYAERRTYKRSDIDFIAAWVVPLDLWYIIPVEAARKVTIYLRPSEAKHGRFQLEKYRERWGLLERSGRKTKCGRQHAHCRRFTLTRHD
jgi:hypothetical protein